MQKWQNETRRILVSLTNYLTFDLKTLSPRELNDTINEIKLS